MQQPQSSSAAPADRIVVLDVRRAVALFGIIVTHSAVGYLAGRPPKPNFMAFTPLDQFVNKSVLLLFSGKFFTIFSFLFGLSFAIQLGRASLRGGSFSVRFAWRLVLLGVIAVIHGAFYSGDILIVYAFLGLLLIPVQGVATKVLVPVAVILVLNIPGLVLGLSRVNATPATVAAAAPPAGASAGLTPQQQFEIKSRGTVAQLVHMNLTDSLPGTWGYQIRTGRGWMTFGLFLLGLCAGRTQLFRDTEANRRFFRRLLGYAAVVALVTTVIAAITPPSGGASTTAGILANFSFSVQQASLSAVYVAMVTLAFWRQPDRGLLPQLAPLGKMGLTTYLAQSVFGVVLFLGIGFGMLGQLGTTAAVGAGIGFFVLQILASRWWMARFSMGPVEWLWRAGTYFTWRPKAKGALAAG